MKADTVLDYLEFRLTPTRTRFELYVYAGDETERLASGLLQPFFSHLRAIEEQITEGGYSIKLKPPDGAPNGNTNASIWFCKGTVERFVRFVNTPEILERLSIVDAELIQLEDSLNTQLKEIAGGEYHSKMASATELLSGGRLTDGLSQNKPVCGALDTSNIEAHENSKMKLLRAMEARRFMLQKEQSMAFARALAAGFKMEYIPHLLLFANCFGAVRLQEACLKFIAICERRQECGVWSEDLECTAEVASSQSNLKSVGNEGVVVDFANAKGALDSWTEVPSDGADELPPHGRGSQPLSHPSQGRNKHSIPADVSGQGSRYFEDLGQEIRDRAQWEQDEVIYHTMQQVQTHPARTFWSHSIHNSGIHHNRAHAYELDPENIIYQYPDKLHLPDYLSTVYQNDPHFQRFQASSSSPHGLNMAVVSNSNDPSALGSIDPLIVIQQEGSDGNCSLSSVDYPFQEGRTNSDGFPTESVISEIRSSLATENVVNFPSDASTLKRATLRSSSPKRRSTSPFRKQIAIKRSSMVLIKNINYIAPDALDIAKVNTCKMDKDTNRCETYELRHLESANSADMITQHAETMGIRVQDAIKLFESKEKTNSKYSLKKVGNNSKATSHTNTGDLSVSEDNSLSTLHVAKQSDVSCNRKESSDSVDESQQVNLSSPRRLIGKVLFANNETLSFPASSRVDSSVESDCRIKEASLMDDHSSSTSVGDFTLPGKNVQENSGRILPEVELERQVAEQFTEGGESSTLPEPGFSYLIYRSTLFHDPSIEGNEQGHANMPQGNTTEDSTESPNSKISGQLKNEVAFSGSDFESALSSVTCLSNNADSFPLPQRGRESATNHPSSLTEIPNVQQTDSKHNIDSLERIKEAVFDESFLVPMRVTSTYLAEAHQKETVDVEFEHQHTLSQHVNKLEDVLRDDEKTFTSAPDEICMLPQRKNGPESGLESWDDHLSYDLQAVEALEQKHHLKDELQLVDSESNSLVGQKNLSNEEKQDKIVVTQKNIRRERQEKLNELQYVSEKKSAKLTVKGLRSSEKSNLRSQAHSRAEKLRAFKTNLAKEKQEKEEKEQKRLEKLRLERRERVAALKSPGLLSSISPPTNRRSSLPSAMPKAKVTLSPKIYKSAIPPLAPVHNLSSSYDSITKVSVSNVLPSNKHHHVTARRPKNVADNVPSRSFPSSADCWKENKSKQNESSKKKDMATLREDKSLLSSSNEDHLFGLQKVSKASSVEPVSQLTLDRNHHVARVAQHAKPFLRKGSGIASRHTFVSQKQKDSVSSDIPKIQGDDHFTPKEVCEKDSESAQKPFVKGLIESECPLSANELEERAEVGPGLSEIHAPASAFEEVNHLLDRDDFESKKEQQLPSAGSLKDASMHENEMPDDVNSDFLYSQGDENTSPPLLMNLSALQSAPHQGTARFLASLSAEETSTVQNCEKNPDNAHVAVLSSSPPLELSAPHSDSIETGCQRALKSEHGHDSLMAVPLPSSLTPVFSGAQHPPKMDFEAGNEENTSQFIDGQVHTFAYEHQLTKQSSKSLKRFLKFGCKGHSSINKAQGSSSAYGVSGYEKDGRDISIVGTQFSDEWSENAVAGSEVAKASSFSSCDSKDRKMWQIGQDQGLNPVLDTEKDARLASQTNIKQVKNNSLQASQLKAPRSFFSLSAFRSRSSNPKTRS